MEQLNEAKDAIIIAISNNKGGVGKTTSTAAIAAALNRSGEKCLMIDADPQGNLGTHFGKKKNNASNLYKAITIAGDRIELPIIKSEDTADIVCSHMDLSKIDAEFSGEAGSVFILKEILEPYKKQYDYILIDCPPSLGMMTMLALTAANLVIIPVELAVFATDGMSNLMQLITKVKGRLNNALQDPIILMTKFDGRKTIQKNFIQLIKKNFKCFSTVIRSNSTVEYSQFNGNDIFKENEFSNVAIDFKKVAEEIINMNSYEQI